MINHKKQAIEDFAKGYNCAQAVFAAFAPEYGIEKQQAYKLACGVGGGFRFAEMCGAISGAVMIIGLKCGNVDNTNIECRDFCYQNTIKFIEEFKKRNRDAMTCKDILGMNIMTPEGKQAAAGSMHLLKERCVQAISAAVDLLEEMGY